MVSAHPGRRLQAFGVILCLIIGSCSASAVVYGGSHTELGSASDKKPDGTDHVAIARWLVAENIWGVLSTVSIHLKGTPFGKVVSFSDGSSGGSTGIPYFYLTEMDPSTQDLVEDSRCSLAIAEATLGTCGKRDPESPACAKITLSGKMKLVRSAKEKKRAEEALFSKHAEMGNWPKSHNFKFYKLVIDNVFLIDWFGGAKPISLDDYYAGRSTAPPSATTAKQTGEARALHPKWKRLGWH